MPPDPSRAYGCGVYKFLKKSADPPLGVYSTLNCALGLGVHHVPCLVTLNAKKLQ